MAARTLPWRLFWLAATVGCATTARPATNAPDEATVMENLRTEAKASPAAALALADDAEARFGETASAEERRAIAIQALIDVGRIGEARSRAYRFLDHYPSGRFSAHVAGMTGVHVTPSGPDQHP